MFVIFMELALAAASCGSGDPSHSAPRIVHGRFAARWGGRGAGRHCQRDLCLLASFLLSQEHRIPWSRSSPAWSPCL